MKLYCSKDSCRRKLRKGVWIVHWILSIIFMNISNRDIHKNQYYTCSFCFLVDQIPNHVCRIVSASKIKRKNSDLWFDFLRKKRDYLWSWSIYQFLKEKKKPKIMSHTSLWSMTHWMSQAGFFLSQALLNAASTSALTILIVICFWDLKDLMAWGICASIFFPENQKECSAKRARTNEILRYLLKIDVLAIPAIAWNLESPYAYNKYNIWTEDRAFNLLGIFYFHLVKIQMEIVEINSK